MKCEVKKCKLKGKHTDFCRDFERGLILCEEHRILAAKVLARSFW